MKKAVATLCLSLFALPAMANEKSSVEQAEKYLNSLSTFQANFEQLTQGEHYASGMFYLKRPNQFLWQYEQPQQQKLVSTGAHIYFYDTASEQTTELPKSSPLSKIFLGKNIKLESEDIQIVSYEKDAGWFALELESTDKKDTLSEGTLTLLFREKPLQLAKLITKDHLGNQTHVAFYNVKAGHTLKEELFEFEAPFSLFPEE